MTKRKIPGTGAGVRRFISASRGQSMTEYALICAMVAFGATAGYSAVASELAGAYNQISAMFTSALGVKCRKRWSE